MCSAVGLVIKGATPRPPLTASSPHEDIITFPLKELAASKNKTKQQQQQTLFFVCFCFVCLSVVVLV